MLFSASKLVIFSRLCLSTYKKITFAFKFLIYLQEKLKFVGSFFQNFLSKNKMKITIIRGFFFSKFTLKYYLDGEMIEVYTFNKFFVSRSIFVISFSFATIWFSRSSANARNFFLSDLRFSISSLNAVISCSVAFFLDHLSSSSRKIKKEEFLKILNVILRRTQLYKADLNSILSIIKLLLSLEIPFVTVSLSFVKKPIKMKFHDNEKFS